MGAGIALFLLSGDNEPGAEIYSAAGDKEQAALVYGAAEKMVRASKPLAKRCRIIPSQKRIIYKPTGGFYRVLSADAPLKHGFNAHGVIYDELHVATNRELWDVLSMSMGARRQPLMVGLTTAGSDIVNSICGQQYRVAKDVLKGIIKKDDFFAYIAEAEKEDDWESPKTWKKANPNLGISVKLEYIQSHCEMAKLQPSYRNEFLRYFLNEWTESHEAWIALEKWKACGGGKVYTENELKGMPCHAGVDLSKTTDITACVFAFPTEDGIQLIPKFYVPAEKMKYRQKVDRVPYETWVNEGYMTATPGDVVDYDFIKKDIIDFSKRFKLVDVGCDPYNASQFIQTLEAEGITCVQMRQGFLSMSEPTKGFEGYVLQKKIKHTNNPVLDWMVANVTLSRDAADNVKPDKKKSRDRIDGAVAAIMAWDRVTRTMGEGNKEGFKDRGLIII